MLYIVVAVGGFLFGVFIMALCAMSGTQDRLDELAEAYRLIGVLWKRVNDAESILLAQRTVTLYDETGMAVEMPVEKANA